MIDITPVTRIGELLEAHPELEEVLVRQAPAFAKLRNPVLRRTVAKVATLEMAARVGGIEVRQLVSTLRREAGLTALEETRGTEPAERERPPAWLDPATVVATIDADEILASGQVPLTPIMARLREIGPGEILLVTCSFEPAPMVQLMRSRGCAAHVRRAGPDRFETFLRRTGDDEDRALS